MILDHVVYDAQYSFHYLQSQYTVSHRSEYTPHIFVIFYYIFSCDNTEEVTLCYNVK